MTELRFNKLCEIEDFSHPDLVPVIRDVSGHRLAELPAEFPAGFEHRKDWEVGMAVRTLQHFGALRPDATILGVAAGIEDTIFYLTRHARQVFATDRYLAPGDWGPTAPLSMLVQPQDMAPYDFDPNRLVTQHMDGRSLRFPDDTFDGIFSSGSIEHFGDLQDVAYAAYEMGRVLKPGGVLTLSTEFRLAGPPGGIGWPGLTLLFSAENLLRFVVEASGLELVDEFRSDVSEATLSAPRDLTLAIEAIIRADALNLAGHRDNYAESDHPHLLLVHNGYVFTSVHLALRKTERYPARPNGWAKPSPELVASISDYNQSLVRGQAEVVSAWAPKPQAAAPAVLAPGSFDEHRDMLSSSVVTLDERLAEIESVLPALDGYAADAAALDQPIADAAQLAAMLHEQRVAIDAWAADLPGDGSADVDDWICATVKLDEGISFDVVVDPRLGDQVTAALTMGWTVDQPLITLMLELVKPGERILDIGAHVGTFSLAAAAAGGHALAVEASPENVAMMRASISRNRFRSVKVIHAVASDEPGRSRFISYGPWGQVAGDGDGDDARAVTVAAVTIEDLVNELNWRPLAFVKIDVEGWESHVMAGMKQLLGAPQAPALLYECNGHTLLSRGSTPEELIAEVAGLGYTSYLVDPGRLVRVNPGDFQPQTLVDYLAVKVPPTLLLDGWTIDNEMSLDERVDRFVTDCRHTNPAQRLYMARALPRAGQELRGHPRVAEAVAGLRVDPDPEVREAMEASL